MKLRPAARILAAALVAVLSGALPATAADKEFALTPYAAVDSRMEEAVLLAATGEWRKAARKALQAESVPLSSRRYLAAGWLGRAQRSKDRAARLAEVAGDPSPLAARAALDLAADATERRKLDEALQWLGRAESAPGVAPDALRARVSILRSLGRTDDARAAATGLLDILPTSRERSDFLLSPDGTDVTDDACRARIVHERYFSDSPRAAALAMEAAWGDGFADVELFNEALYGRARTAELPEKKRSGTWEAAIVQGGALRQARGRKDDALASFVEARRLATSMFQEGAAQYLEARTLEALDRDLDAAEVFHALLAEHPEFPLRRNVEMRLATIAVREGQPLRAVERLRDYLATACPGEDLAEPLWLMGFVEFLSGHFDSAALHWRELQRHYFFDTSFGWVLYGTTALYWQARAAERSGRSEEAQAGYRSLASEFSGSYYAVAARSRLEAGTQALELPAPARLEASPVSVPESIVLPEEYAGAVELFRLGLWSASVEEIRRLLPATGPRRGIAALAASAWVRSRSLHETIELRKSLGLMPPPWDNGSRFWRRSLPLAFPEAIRHGHGESGLDPALTAAIIRFESDYNPRCASRAGAYGLLQVKENTGSHVATNCLNQKPVRRKELFDPLRNLQLGTIYIAGLSVRHHDNWPVTLAAYNAGPGTASWWLERFSGLSTDSFVEQITYPNTVGYVKRILGVTPLYWSLYHPMLGRDPPRLDVPDVIPPELGPFLDPAKGCPRGTDAP